MTHNVALFLLLSVAICSAQAPPKPSPPGPPKPAGAKPSPEKGPSDTVEELKKQIADLHKQIDSLYDLVIGVNNLVVDIAPFSATFDPASPDKYHSIATPAGSLLVSLEKVEPYLDGYKVELQIGNPLVATFRGFDVVATWKPRLVNYPGPYSDWVKQEKSKTFSFTQDLFPAHWNRVELILPDTKPDQFGQLKVSLSINTIVMETPLSK